MWIGLTEGDQTFWRHVAELARSEVLPHVLEWDDRGQFPPALWQRLGTHGLLGLACPEQYGGAGAGPRRLALALDAFAYGSKDLGVVNSWGVHSAMVGTAILRVGTDLQREKYLSEMSAGSLVGAFALTEPDAGSHAAAIQTKARRDDDGYILNGSKAFVTNGPQADVFLVIARSGDDKAPEFSAFLVDRDQPGLLVGPAEAKSCIRTSPCCDLELRDCRVSSKQRLGDEGQAFETVVLPALDWDRCVIWAGRLGRLRTILEDCTAYAKKRKQFGRPIWRHQAILFKLADMKVQLNAAEILMSQALVQLERGDSVRLDAAVARLFLGEATIRCAGDAVQIFGGSGFYPKNHVERFHRDARLDGIGGGTFEIQRMMIGRSVVDSMLDAKAPWMSGTIFPGPKPVETN